jgi:hypothetical protein
MSVRQLTKLEAQDQTFLPLALRDHGFPYLDTEWCWIVEHEGRAIAIVVCSFAHGMLILWRILATQDAKRVQRTWFLDALPQILSNAKQRGCVGYLTMLEDHHPACVKLARIMARTGGALKPFVGTLGVAAIDP